MAKRKKSPNKNRNQHQAQNQSNKRSRVSAVSSSTRKGPRQDTQDTSTLNDDYSNCQNVHDKPLSLPTSKCRVVQGHRKQQQRQQESYSGPQERPHEKNPHPHPHARQSRPGVSRHKNHRSPAPPARNASAPTHTPACADACTPPSSTMSSSSSRIKLRSNGNNGIKSINLLLYGTLDKIRDRNSRCRKRKSGGGGGNDSRRSKNGNRNGNGSISIRKKPKDANENLYGSENTKTYGNDQGNDGKIIHGDEHDRDDGKNTEDKVHRDSSTLNMEAKKKHQSQTQIPTQRNEVKQQTEDDNDKNMTDASALIVSLAVTDKHKNQDNTVSVTTDDREEKLDANGNENDKKGRKIDADRKGDSTILTDMIINDDCNKSPTLSNHDKKKFLSSSTSISATVRKPFSALNEHLLRGCNRTSPVKTLQKDKKKRLSSSTSTTATMRQPFSALNEHLLGEEKFTTSRSNVHVPTRAAPIHELNQHLRQSQTSNSSSRNEDDIRNCSGSLCPSHSHSHGESPLKKDKDEDDDDKIEVQVAAVVEQGLTLESEPSASTDKKDVNVRRSLPTKDEEGAAVYQMKEIEALLETEDGTNINHHECINYATRDDDGGGDDATSTEIAVVDKSVVSAAEFASITSIVTDDANRSMDKDTETCSTPFKSDGSDNSVKTSSGASNRVRSDSSCMANSAIPISTSTQEPRPAPTRTIDDEGVKTCEIPCGEESKEIDGNENTRSTITLGGLQSSSQGDNVNQSSSPLVSKSLSINVDMEFVDVTDESVNHTSSSIKQPSSKRGKGESRVKRKRKSSKTTKQPKSNSSSTAESTNCNEDLFVHVPCEQKSSTLLKDEKYIQYCMRFLHKNDASKITDLYSILHNETSDHPLNFTRCIVRVLLDAMGFECRRESCDGDDKMNVRPMKNKKQSSGSVREFIHLQISAAKRDEERKGCHSNMMEEISLAYRLAAHFVLCANASTTSSSKKRRNNDERNSKKMNEAVVNAVLTLIVSLRGLLKDLMSDIELSKEKDLISSSVTRNINTFFSERIFEGFSGVELLLIDCVPLLTEIRAEQKLHLGEKRIDIFVQNMLKLDGNIRKKKTSEHLKSEISDGLMELFFRQILCQESSKSIERTRNLLQKLKTRNKASNGALASVLHSATGLCHNTLERITNLRRIQCDIMVTPSGPHEEISCNVKSINSSNQTQSMERKEDVLRIDGCILLSTIIDILKVPHIRQNLRRPTSLEQLRKIEQMAFFFFHTLVENHFDGSIGRDNALSLLRSENIPSAVLAALLLSGKVLDLQVSLHRLLILAKQALAQEHCRESDKCSNQPCKKLIKSYERQLMASFGFIGHNYTDLPISHAHDLGKLLSLGKAGIFQLECLFQHRGYTHSALCLLEDTDLILFALYHFGCEQLGQLKKCPRFHKLFNNDETRTLRLLSDHMMNVFRYTQQKIQMSPNSTPDFHSFEAMEAPSFRQLVNMINFDDKGNPDF